MTANRLYAAAAVLLLGTAAIGASAVLTAAQALTVSAEVGKALTEAQSLITSGEYKAAMVKLNEAEKVLHKTADEEKVITAMKDSIAVYSGDTSSALGAKAKFSKDYAAGKYTDVIADADALKRTGALDAQSMEVVAQSYYESGNKAGCLKYIKTNLGTSGAEDTLRLLMRCAYDAGDEDTERAALEQLVSRTGKPEYWSDLLKLSERAKALADHQTLDIYRLKFLTSTINGKDEYTLLAQLAMQLGFPGEGAAVVQKGMSLNLLTDDKSKRLLALAKQEAAADAVGQAQAIATANKDPMGDALVKIGENQWGNGNYKDAIDTVQAGMKKNLKDKDNAQIVLGMAYIGAGQKDMATRTLGAVKGSDNATMVAHLWSLYGATGQGIKASSGEKPAKKH